MSASLSLDTNCADIHFKSRLSDTFGNARTHFLGLQMAQRSQPRLTFDSTHYSFQCWRCLNEYCDEQQPLSSLLNKLKTFAHGALRLVFLTLSH